MPMLNHCQAIRVSEVTISGHVLHKHKPNMRARGRTVSEFPRVRLARCPGRTPHSLGMHQAPHRRDRHRGLPVQSKTRAPLFAARTLNATGQSRVTLSLR